MARPLKEGLDYFPLDVDVDQDDKVAIIEGMHGVVGFGIVIKLLMHIYKNSYYYRWTEKQQIIFARRVNVNIDEVNAVVNDCVKWGMFDEKMFVAYQILTSRGVQKRYFEITKRRQKVEVIEEYLLVEDSDINAYTNLVYVNIKFPREDKCIHDVDISSQSKGKESKGKESKGKDGTVAADSIHKEVVEYLNEKTGKSYSHTSKATQQMIRARQNDGFSLEDFKYVIDIKSAQWKDDPKMDKFLRPSTLFRPSNFESYLQEKPNLKKVRAGDFEISSETEKQLDKFEEDNRIMDNMSFEQKTQYLLGNRRKLSNGKDAPMAKEEHIPHPLYADEPIDIVAPDWVAKSFYLVPRLKIKARKNPKTPWELNDEIKEKMENRQRAMEDYDKKTGRKGQ